MSSEMKEFKYQRFILKWLFSILFVIIGMVCAYPLSFLISVSNPLFIVAAACVVALVFVIYYFITSHWKVFDKTGYYWTTGKIVHIQLRKKEYDLTSISQIIKSTNTFFGVRCAVLTIVNDGRKLNIQSLPIKKDELIEQSSLNELFQLLLKNNPKLKITVDSKN